jgi:thymidylate synthase
MASSLLPSADHQYADLVRQVLSRGVRRADRTGVGTWALHGAMMRLDLSDRRLPLLTTKRVAWKTAAKETLWFLSGDRRLRTLLAQNVRIWSDWPHARYVRETGDPISLAEFEARILADDAFDARWGDLGPLYGVQWRRWPDGQGGEIDQISQTLARLKSDPTSRRLLWHAWNPAQIDQMALPPCHLLYQLFADQGRLSLTLYQRSCDVGLGLPFNLIGASLLCALFAQQAGLVPHELVWMGHDVHIYATHAEALEDQVARAPRPTPRLHLSPAPDLFSYTPSHIRVEGYDPHPAVPLPVAV